MRNDPFERTTSRISTWIYFILMCLLMIIIVLFIGLSVQIRSMTIENPSESTFECLQEKYPRSLQCPCSQIIIPHNFFTSLSPQFHPVCTSEFISDLWFKSITEAGWFQNNERIEDIFISGNKYFKSLSSLCQLIKTTVSDAYSIFKQSSLITDHSLSNVEFMARARQAFDQFVLNTATEVKYSIELIRSQISTLYTTEDKDSIWKLSRWRNNSYSMHFQPVPKQLDNCSCELDDECKVSMVLYNYSTYMNVFPLRRIYNMSNMFVGCFPILSVLQSSLECMFDQICFDLLLTQMKKLLTSARQLNISILQSNSTRFSPKTLIGDMVNEMMIETWNENINYSKYYIQCAPKHCSYFDTSRNEAIYVFTTMIGLFGGLSVALTIIVPFIVGWIRDRIRTRNQTDNVTS